MDLILSYLLHRPDDWLMVHVQADAAQLRILRSVSKLFCISTEPHTYHTVMWDRGPADNSHPPVDPGHSRLTGSVVGQGIQRVCITWRIESAKFPRNVGYQARSSGSLEQNGLNLRYFNEFNKRFSLLRALPNLERVDITYEVCSNATRRTFQPATLAGLTAGRSHKSNHRHDFELNLLVHPMSIMHNLPTSSRNVLSQRCQTVKNLTLAPQHILGLSWPSATHMTLRGWPTVHRKWGGDTILAFLGSVEQVENLTLGLAHIGKGIDDDFWRSIKMPKLRTLTLYDMAMTASQICDLLYNHPTLEEITFAHLTVKVHQYLLDDDNTRRFSTDPPRLANLRRVAFVNTTGSGALLEDLSERRRTGRHEQILPELLNVLGTTREQLRELCIHISTTTFLRIDRKGRLHELYDSLNILISELPPSLATLELRLPFDELELCLGFKVAVRKLSKTRPRLRIVVHNIQVIERTMRKKYEDQKDGVFVDTLLHIRDRERR